MTTIAATPRPSLFGSGAQSVIRTLPSITRADIAVVGGKGANLGEMLAAETAGASGVRRHRRRLSPILRGE